MEGKGRRCWLRDILECRTSILGGWLFGVVWTRWHFSKASIPPSILSSILPFLQIILVLHGYSAARNWISSILQPAVTFCLPFFLILLLWIQDYIHYTVQLVRQSFCSIITLSGVHGKVVFLGLLSASQAVSWVYRYTVYLQNNQIIYRYWYLQQVMISKNY